MRPCREASGAHRATTNILGSANEGSAHKRRRHPGDRPARDAACAARGCPAIELAVIAPDSNRSASARSITTRSPLWVEEVEFGDGTSRLRDRRHAGRLRPLRGAGPDRVRARADRRRASTTAPTSATTSPIRGRSPRRSRAPCSACRRSPSRSSRRSARWTSASVASSTSSVAASFTAAPGRAARGAADLAGNAAERQLPGASRPGSSQGAEVTRLGKRIYRDKLELEEEDRSGRPPQAPVPDLRRRPLLPPRGRHGLRGDPRRQDLGDAAALRAHRRRADGGAARLGPREPDRPGRRGGGHAARRPE